VSLTTKVRSYRCRQEPAAAAEIRHPSKWPGQPDLAAAVHAGADRHLPAVRGQLGAGVGTDEKMACRSGRPRPQAATAVSSVSASSQPARLPDHGNHRHNAPSLASIPGAEIELRSGALAGSAGWEGEP
jgi:hypothetical protein